MSVQKNKKTKSGISRSQINPTKVVTTVMVYSGPLNHIGLPETGRSTK